MFLRAYKNYYHIAISWHLTIIHTAVRCVCSDRRQSLDLFKDMPLDVATTVAEAKIVTVATLKQPTTRPDRPLQQYFQAKWHSFDLWGSIWCIAVVDADADDAATDWVSRDVAQSTKCCHYAGPACQNALNRANIPANKAIKFDCQLEGGTVCSFLVALVAATTLTVASGRCRRRRQVFFFLASSANGQDLAEPSRCHNKPIKAATCSSNQVTFIGYRE